MCIHVDIARYCNGLYGANLESIDCLFATNCYVTPRNDSGTTVERQWNASGTTVERHLGLSPMFKQQLQGILKLFELFLKYLTCSLLYLRNVCAYRLVCIYC